MPSRLCKVCRTHSVPGPVEKQEAIYGHCALNVTLLCSNGIQFKLYMQLHMQPPSIRPSKWHGCLFCRTRFAIR